MSVRGYSDKDFEPVREASVTNPEDFDGDILNTYPDKSKEENPVNVLEETTYRETSVIKLPLQDGLTKEENL